MNKFLIFIIACIINIHKLLACGFMPLGEEIRYSLFLPEYYSYSDLSAFNYNANIFGYYFEYNIPYEANVYDWYQYSHREVALSEIKSCLNELSFNDINQNTLNAFTKFLYKKNDWQTIQYLKIAKKCEIFNNAELNDSWERDSTSKLNSTAILDTINQILKRNKTEYFNRKYAFLAIRVAYYTKKPKIIRTYFEKYFQNKHRDYLYYWALFFYAFQSNNIDLYASDIAANSYEKRYASYYYFNSKFSLQRGLSKATNRSEIANLYAYASLQRKSPNLDYLKIIYNNSKHFRLLDFLLLREINKLEDWIYTPYYTNFLPSINFNSAQYHSESNDIITIEILRKRSEKDRQYAHKLLHFVNKVNYSKVLNPALWKAAEIQLLFMTREYKKCLHKIALFERLYAKEKILPQIEKIKVLCQIEQMPYGEAKINKAIKPLIIKYIKDPYFVFAAGRELEFKGNIQEGLALIAYQNQWPMEYDIQTNNFVEWMDHNRKNTGVLNYFTDYFDYVDLVYPAVSLQKVVNRLNVIPTEPFDSIIYTRLIKDKNYLSDLLGTKYIRENLLWKALKTFESIDSNYWENNYNAWERDKFDDQFLFDKNPFYDLKYTKSFIEHRDKFFVNKLSIVRHLIQYLNLADNKDTKNRDYYYFIIANCYLNMSRYGNSWMLRRFYYPYGRSSDGRTFTDNYEYWKNTLAQKYYNLAYIHSKSDKFKALCLRMLDYINNSCTIDQPMQQLKTHYPQYYEDLSNCENLDKYFSNR